MNVSNSKLELSPAENLLLEEIRESKIIIKSTNSQIVDLAIRMTRIEIGNTNNETSIKDIYCRIDSHINDHKYKRNIIFAAIISFLSAIILASYQKILGFFK